VPADVVGVAPQRHVGRHRQHEPAAGRGAGAEAAQGAGVVFEVFEHVEHADQVERVGERQSVHVGPHDRAADALPRELDAHVRQLRAHHFGAAALLLQHPQDGAGAAADLQGAVAGGEVAHRPAHGRGDDAVAAAEPEVPVLGGEQLGEGVVGFGHAPLRWP
jgi:hypothetical protein